MKLYHLSKDLNFKKHFSPRVPKLNMPGENDTIKRISFSLSIEDALTALPNSISNDPSKEAGPFFRVYEYTVKDSDKILEWEDIYKKEYINDVFVTSETWILNDIKFKEEDSYLIGITSFKVDEADLISPDIYYEAMAGDGNYLKLYMEKTGEKVPFVYTVCCLKYIKISDSLKELEKVDENHFRIPRNIDCFNHLEERVNYKILADEDGLKEVYKKYNINININNKIQED